MKGFQNRVSQQEASQLQIKMEAGMGGKNDKRKEISGKMEIRRRTRE